MPTIQHLIDDIKLRYRHTFTTDQVLVWMNDELRQLYEIFQIESPPYAFTTVKDVFFYPIPADMDKDRIKVVTIQVNDQVPPMFQQLEFKRNDDEIRADLWENWYTIIENNFYINVVGGTQDNRTVYVYYDARPQEVSSSNLSIEPPIPSRFHEVLKIGVLKRIAAARKDIVMRNNYDAEYQEFIRDYEWRMKMSEPEFVQPADMLPRRRAYTIGIKDVYSTRW